MSSCCECLFSSQEDFYGRVPMDRNVESENVEIAIRETQLKYIKPLLCDDLYEELCDQILAGYLSPINEELLCFIKDVHVRYAFSNFVFIHPVRVTKESVVRKLVDESEFVDFETNEKHANFWRRQAENWIPALKKFLNDHTEDNPLYTSCGCICKKHNEDLGDWGIC